MAKKAISGGRGVLGITYSGKTQARVPSATRSGDMPRADQTVQKGVRYTNQPMVDKGRVVKTMNPMRSRQQATSLVGGLGMQPYMNPKPSMQMRTGLTTTTAERTKMYGGAPSKAAGSFGQAFAAARKAGQPTFSFGGKSYTTAMKGESRPSGAKKTTGTTRTATGGGKAPSSFGKAFASARAAGKSTFSFGGKSYTTAMKGGGGKVSPASSRGNAPSRSLFGSGGLFGGGSKSSGSKSSSSKSSSSRSSGGRSLSGKP
jgi:hypothetical protein